MNDQPNDAETPKILPAELALLVNNAIMDLLLNALRWGVPQTSARRRKQASDDGFYKARLAFGHMRSMADQGYVFDGIAVAYDDAGAQWTKLETAIRTDIGPVI